MEDGDGGRGPVARLNYAQRVFVNDSLEYAKWACFLESVGVRFEG